MSTAKTSLSADKLTHGKSQPISFLVSLACAVAVRCSVSTSDETCLPYASSSFSPHLPPTQGAQQPPLIFVYNCRCLLHPANPAETSLLRNHLSSSLQEQRVSRLGKPPGSQVPGAAPQPFAPPSASSRQGYPIGNHMFWDL